MAENRRAKDTESNSSLISAEEAALYDRQIRLWGLDAQKRLRASNVLLFGLNGLGAEICKNIVLCGVKSLTLMDNQNVTEDDYTAQFLIPRADLGKNRAKACLARAQRLNPMVEIRTDIEEIKTKDSKFFKDFDVVILTGCALDVMVQVNEICHELKIKFYAGDVFGFFGFAFNDLVQHKFVEEQKKSTGVNLTENEVPPQKKAKQEETETILIEKFLDFTTLEKALDTTWVKDQKPKFLKRISKVYFIFQVLLRFHQANGRNPQGLTSTQDIVDLQKIKREVLKYMETDEDLISDDFARHCMGTISPTCSVIGGILSQDVIKALSGKDAPINNFFFFDGLTGEGMVECLPIKSSH
ncbi:SUMO-activating enzyme subunit 1-like [Xenia sp. Carnegie-2017]|uniref:SUMO-activating enzyme subunit 1-like n=1 Tax=Xenia sp. Carnegie-2017 TaxID=2897299 RepID=UPI001F04CEB1|nr:SUMO-activating enzyme subunit 1-like [Xenia sp. Carnegie-2017]